MKAATWYEQLKGPGTTREWGRAPPGQGPAANTAPGGGLQTEAMGKQHDTNGLSSSTVVSTDLTGLQTWAERELALRGREGHWAEHRDRACRQLQREGGGLSLEIIRRQLYFWSTRVLGRTCQRQGGKSALPSRLMEWACKGGLRGPWRPVWGVQAPGPLWGGDSFCF